MIDQIIVLNSTSSARKTLLKRLQIPFISCDPNVDETPLPNELPKAMVRRLAEMKAKATTHSYKNALVIGCDQILSCEQHIFGKPLEHQAAVNQLRLSSGKVLHSLSGLAVYNTATTHCQISVVPTKVVMRKLTSEMIENYLRRERPYHCAGSIKAESLGIALIETMESSDPNALTGLPLIKLVMMLENEGYKVI